MTEPRLSPEELDLLAAEHALGLPEGEDRARAMRLYLSEPAFRAAVDTWQERLEPLYSAVAKATPSEAVWLGISDATRDSGKTVPLRRLRLWQVGGIAATAVAASLLVALLTPRQENPITLPAPAFISQPVAIAQLLSPDGEEVMVARFEDQTGRLHIRAAEIDSPDGVPELWVIPAGGAPISLGLIAPKSSQAIELASAKRTLITDGATLAISLEKADGAPHAAPAGPIIATGAINRI